ncbi:hypothetical protein HW555_001055 [Spodoptera exigua]|uniref:gamma-glutamylcyclotransferase n=1 Tax=Spodoptera exigua TaxID=7107 RepID=A0A835GTC9_SPOEX|nr:hypothetical protein HW555_001055 [Spodoptera exigua]KAH9642063.1 hypothetical protein HF086_015184 [Spodoptera exigua]
MSLCQIFVIAYLIKIFNIALCYMLVHPVKQHFLYFAYGSNLLKRRIKINNPHAEFVGVGRLDNFRLDFVSHYNLWGGSVATIVPHIREHVWGAIWKMQYDEMPSLDKQEGVDLQQYVPRQVNVYYPDGKQAKCRTYQHMNFPVDVTTLDCLPENRRPSITYKQCIIKGAYECKIPKEYIKKLESIPTNGKLASETLRKFLRF